MSNPQLAVVVSVEWLERHRGDVVLADVRWYLDGRSGHAAYLAGHLPGAVFVDIDEHLAAPASPQGGRHPLPEPERLAADLGALGIGDDSTIVAYDDSGGSTAARLVWILRALGGRAALLDGGIAAWTGELETGAVTPRPRQRTPVPWPHERLASHGEVRALGTGVAPAAQTLLDARIYERFTGTQPAPVDARAGHIPGARSAPWQDNLDSHGRFAPAAQLREQFGRLGVDRDSSVVGYCGSGVTACHTLLALEHAGLGPGRLYPGSWSVWGAAPELPVATGPDNPR